MQYKRSFNWSDNCALQEPHAKTSFSAYDVNFANSWDMTGHKSTSAKHQSLIYRQSQCTKNSPKSIMNLVSPLLIKSTHVTAGETA
jgi:hypothetical protein